MQPLTRSRIADWETRPADDGYAGVHALSESAFSGVITASEAALFMLNGRSIGLTGGSVETFETAPLTAYSAPHPALPLLLAMEEQGGETQATYYTNDTSLDEVASTLESGGFTGYVELSENVLSGDYYLVYHQGRSMAVGFVGSNGRLLTDAEAESRIYEEVGVYTVRTVAISEIPIPEPATVADGTEPPSVDADDDSGVPDGPRSDRTATSEDPVPPGTSDDDRIEPADGSDPTPPEARNEAEPRPTGSKSRPTVEGSETNVDATPSVPTMEEPTTDGAARDEPTAPRDRWGSVIDEPVEDRIAAERQWRETTRIPSLDPDRSAITPSGEGETANAAVETAEPEPGEAMLSRALEALETERELRESAERRVAQLDEEVTRLEERLSDVENDTSEGADARADPAAESTSGRSLDSTTALSGTNLFVRYASKAGATLESAHAGETDRETLAENLRLERRTEFESANATVEGEPFEAFLIDRLEYRFAEWLVGDLPFELAETGHANSLSTLYDALPAIDRVELHGTVDVGEETRHFDVVCRDRMGQPLFVVDCVDSRVATTEERVADLVEAATETTDAASGLASAMLVTTSYFDPGALSTAAEATQSGLLGGGSRESYVTISRRSGYHLCLVEMHDGTFHVSVPEL